MSVSAAYKDFLKDLLSGFGPVSIRNMFRGAGVYADGVMFAILDETPSTSRPMRLRRAPSPMRGKVPSPIVPRAAPRSPCPIRRFPIVCSTTLMSSSLGRDGRMQWRLPPRLRRAADV
jgi:hypothetical protein